MPSLRSTWRFLVGFGSCWTIGIATTWAAPTTLQRTEHEGIEVTFDIESERSATGMLREGDPASFRFQIADTTSGAPISGIYPAAWVQKIDPNQPVGPQHCIDMVEELLAGSLFTRADLDLNVYYVLALNDDASISVVDPLFGFGSTKLLAMVLLESPGEDWALTKDQRTLYVSQPSASKVAVVDTTTWKIREQIEVGGPPHRLRLQPDEAYLWVALEGDGRQTTSGIAAIDTRNMLVAAELATGDGPHDLVLATDDRYAFLTNQGAGTVTVIDVPALEEVAEIETGSRPSSIDYAPRASTAYVTDPVDGTIVAIDGRKHEVIARIKSEPGVGMIRFAPDGRTAVVVNPKTDRLQVLDAARNRIVQTGLMRQGPDQVAFSDSLAYVRHRDSEIVLMLPLEVLGQEGSPLAVVDFPGGESPFGRQQASSPADSIVRAPGATAVLVANPADQMIYYYKEGMAAPMGGFRTYDREPRAVQVVDRSLRERQRPGLYETAAKLGEPGDYEIAFFLDTPRIVHCFTARIEPNPVLEAMRRKTAPIKVQPLFGNLEARAGSTVDLRFEITDPTSGRPIVGLRDLEVIAYNTAHFKKRLAVIDEGDGIYLARFTIPAATGPYIVSVASVSGRLGFAKAPRRVLHAVAPPTDSSASSLP